MRQLGRAPAPDEEAKVGGAGPVSGPMPMPAAGSPGKTTLTQLRSPSWRATSSPSRSGTAAPPPRSTAAGEASAGTRRSPPPRVADAVEDSARSNAVLKILVLHDGQVIRRWQSKARWEGPLPRRYTAARAGAGWRWDDAEGKSIKVQTDERGAGGKSVEAWAGTSADRIVVHAQALDDVTLDADAEPDARAPGHARDPEDAGDGSTGRIRPSGEGSGTGDTAPRRGGASRVGDPAQRGGDPRGAGERGREGDDGGGTAREPEQGFEPRAADEQLADDFERELGLDLDDDTSDGDGDGDGGDEGGGKGEAGGDRKGRTGEDTRRGSTGPGGEDAKADGAGKGSETGKGPRGSEGGSRDGEPGGDEEGMYGGEGQRGDRGVPSAIALFGGLISVPAALRGFVELALIVSSADLTGAGAQLFKKGLGKIASAAAARKMIAHEARVAAVHETKAVIKRISTDKRTARAWAKATAEERNQAMRIIYWELQRKYFQGYLEAAKRAKAEAKAALRKSPKSAEAQRSLATAEMAEEAATVSPVAGRLPQNHELAGKQFPSGLLPPAYRKQGLKFTGAGFPDFEPYAMSLPNGKKYVEIGYTGSRPGDLAAANAKAGFAETPALYTWHHSEELGRMYLIPSDLHKSVKHTGGVATYKHVTGDVASYAN